MARPASGSVRWNKTTSTWECRVTLANGARSKPIPLTGFAACAITPTEPDRTCSCEPCKAARETGKAISERMRSGAHVDVASEETANEWHERYLQRHAELGRQTRTWRAPGPAGSHRRSGRSRS